MSFQTELQNYELSKLLDYFNLEVSSFKLQSEAISVGFLIENTNITIDTYFSSHLKIPLQSFEFTKGVYRLLKYVPDFKQQADKLLYFEDDVFEFKNLQTNQITEMMGKQILVSYKFKILTLKELLPHPGLYKLTIKSGRGREQCYNYIKQANYIQEFSNKIGLHENIRHCFLKNQQNFQKIDNILAQRFQLLHIPKPIIDWVKISLLPAQQRPEYLVAYYDLPNMKVVNTNDCLQIKQIYNSFGLNITNEHFFKQINKNQSYGFHIEKFIKQLKYQVNRTIRQGKL